MSTSHMAPSARIMGDEHGAVSLFWLVRLRWLLVGGQALAAATAATTPGVSLDTLRALACIACTAASNFGLLAYLRSRRPAPPALCGAALLLDTLVLTMLLHSGGGPSNPFSVLYLVHITLASLLLDSAWTYTIAGLSVLGFGALFFGAEHARHMGHDFATHLRGMWLAFTLTAGLTAAFAVRVTGAIRGKDREIERIREQATRTERLAALTTLAAGAAHELGSPLATIAVAAGELDRAVERMPVDQAAAIRDDAKLIRRELERCRDIIDRMTAAAGEVTGEAPEVVSVTTLMDTVRSELSKDEAERLRTDLATEASAAVPHRALARAIGSLVRNGFDASGAGANVDVAVTAAGEDRLRFTVVDRGEGMPEEVLAKATDPFFTTKAPGRGMGMGLFLARVLVEQIGGQLALVSTPGQGTAATLEIPTGLPNTTTSTRGK